MGYPALGAGKMLDFHPLESKNSRTEFFFEKCWTTQDLIRTIPTRSNDERP